MQERVITFKATEDFEKFLDKQASNRKLKRGPLIKAVLKKYLKYKEPELV